MIFLETKVVPVNTFLEILFWECLRHYRKVKILKRLVCVKKIKK